MFSFVPKSEAEISAIANQGLLTEGVYSFRVKEIIARKSRASNDMLEVKLGIMDNDGNERNIYDFLVATDRMIFKLKHFCETLGFEKDYSEGKLDTFKCLNKSGKLAIGIQKGNAKEDGSGYYPDRNNVKDYVKIVPSNFDDDLKF